MAAYDTVRLCEIATIRSGYAFKSADWTDEGVPVIKIQNVRAGRVDPSGCSFVSAETAAGAQRYRLSEGDILVTMSGEIGSIGLVRSSDGWMQNQRVGKVEVQHELCEAMFVYYALLHPDIKREMEATAYGAAQPNISPKLIGALEIPMPDKTVQGAVSETLSAFDELIENNTRRIKILEEMAQSIYKEWFVNFRYPGHENVPLVDSELGPIPEGWRVQPLRDTAELAYGKALRAQDRREGQVPVLGSGGVTGFHDAALVPGPGVVVGRKGNVGSVHWIDVDFYPIDTTFFVRTEFSMRYLYYVLRSLDFIDSHAAVPGLSRDQAYGLPVLVPDDHILDEFDELIGGMFDLVARLRASADILRGIRDLLLPRLVSGEIDVAALDFPGE